jgi:predicted metal-dependent phosphotriesterase family hydrolase
LFTDLLPALKTAGFGDDEIDLLTITNPAKAFTIGVRGETQKE